MNWEYNVKNEGALKTDCLNEKQQSLERNRTEQNVNVEDKIKST